MVRAPWRCWWLNRLVLLDLQRLSLKSSIPPLPYIALRWILGAYTVSGEGYVLNEGRKHHLAMSFVLGSIFSQDVYIFLPGCSVLTAHNVAELS